MFIPKTKKIADIATSQQFRIKELENLFCGSVKIYIDYANVLSWRGGLGWNIDLKRLKQFMDSFDNILDCKIYTGTLLGEIRSVDSINQMKSLKYSVITKPVKSILYKINTSILNNDLSLDLIKNLLKKAYLKIISSEGIIANNKELRKLNNDNILFLEDKKCNFDVEIGRDLLRDFIINPVDTYVVWTSDSDFEEPLSQLLKDNKRVILFSTAGKTAREINNLRKNGLIIFDINKIKDFICWNRGLKAKEAL